jgi:hypothetical protein
MTAYLEFWYYSPSLFSVLDTLYINTGDELSEKISKKIVKIQKNTYDLDTLVVNHWLIAKQL